MVDLHERALLLMAPGKGILAADESNASADEKRLAPLGIPTGPEMRRKFRDLFLEAPGIEAYLSGVILFTETLGQKSDEDGLLFAKSLLRRSIMPGVKVDEGLEPFPGSEQEMITKGLLGLPERLAEYKKNDTGFTKWRAVISIDGDRLPTAQCLVENAKRLATYASEVQKAGMVPTLEPEVLLDGKHSRLRAKEVILQTMKTVFAALSDQAVDLGGLLVKTSMAVSGNKSGKTDTPEEVAESTIEALVASVPKNVAGIVFLSGGQTPEQATHNLGAIARLARSSGAPWPVSFSFARALQEEALAVWAGKDEKMVEARGVFLTRLKAVSEALTA